MPPIVLEEAFLLCYRIVDISESIDLEKARACLAQDTRRLKLTRAGSEYVQLPNPPLAVELGRRAVPLRGATVSAELGAHLFDFGAASIILRVPVAKGTSLAELVPLADELFDSVTVDQLAVEVAEQLRKDIGPALENSHLWTQSESYTVVFVRRLGGTATPQELLAAPELPRLLLGETGTRPLSRRECDDVLEQHFSYTDDDLAVIDWNAAFVYEPSGSLDIPELLEIANAQLLEFRYYDDVLDRQLRAINEEVAAKKGASVLRSPYNKLARRVYGTLIELSEFIERVENSLKIIGDVYLAKVYEAAVRQLRIPSWQSSVTRKQRVLSQTYELLRGEVATSRSLMLEATIVVLIVLEMALAGVQFLRP